MKFVIYGKLFEHRNERKTCSSLLTLSTDHNHHRYSATNQPATSFTNEKYRKTKHEKLVETTR